MPEALPKSSLRRINGQENITQNYADYLQDESRLSGSIPDMLFFPASTSEVSQAVSECYKNNLRFAVSGGRTGIVGGAVSINADAVISLSNLKGISKSANEFVNVMAGNTLDELYDFIEDNSPDLFYPVDPTETTATIGGTIATNASGARTYFYGPTRNWVNAITVVLADGSILNLKRGEIIAESRTFRIQLSTNPTREFTFPTFHYPDVKNTTGYQLKSGMDAIDLFIGSEGTLGIITEAELKLIPEPENRLYTMVWLQSENQAVDFAFRVHKSGSIKPLAIEYFDPNAIALLKRRRESEGSSSQVPMISENAKAAIFIDCIYSNESNLCELTDCLCELLADFGLTPDDTWSGLEDRDLTKMKQLRHAVPETVNMIVAERKKNYPEIHKLSTDLALPDGKLKDMLEIYHSELDKSKIEYVSWGHIGDNHIHFNMLPSNSDELSKAKELYDYFASEAVKLGGTVAGEHGIGRLKRHLMKLQYPDFMLDSMMELKRILDPKMLNNVGVLLP